MSELLVSDEDLPDLYTESQLAQDVLPNPAVNPCVQVLVGAFNPNRDDPHNYVIEAHCLGRQLQYVQAMLGIPDVD